MPKPGDYIDLNFPLAGIDLSAAYGKQPARALQSGEYARTTIGGLNVRGCEPGTLRFRGGSRPGLARYINARPAGVTLIQELATVVGSGYTPPGGAHATAAFVQRNSAQFVASVNPRTCAFTSNLTAGNFVCVGVDMASTVTVTVTDTLGHAYQQAGSYVTQGVGRIALFYVPNCAGGANTVTVTPSGNTALSIAIREYSGVDTRFPLHGVKTNAGTSVNPTSGLIPATSGDLVISCLNAYTGAVTTTVAAPFTQRTDLLLFDDTTATGSVTADYTLNVANDYVCISASFSPLPSVTLTDSGRVITLVAVAAGDVYVAAPGSTGWTMAVNGTGYKLNTAGPVRSAVNVGRLWFADGAHWFYYDPFDNTVYAWAALAGTLPVDSAGNKPKLIETWRGRTVLSGLVKDPQNVFMSAVGDPFNWDYAPASPSPTQAVAFNASPFGLVGDRVTALVPFGDDELIIGGDHTLWRMSGDPMAGGSLDRISDAIGMAWGKPWCKDPYGNVYFFSNLCGIYQLAPGQQPLRISQQIERLLQLIDTGYTTIRMAWDDRFQGLHVFTSATSTGNPANKPVHYFWEMRSGAWWSDSFDDHNQDPLCCCTFDGDSASDRVALIGSWDGYVRFFKVDAADDDGTAISSRVVFGPALTKYMDEVILKNMQAELGTSSGTVTWSVFASNTRQIDLPFPPTAPGVGPTADYTGQWVAGHNFTSHVRRSFRACYVMISSGVPWTIETIRLWLKGDSEVRRRMK